MREMAIKKLVKYVKTIELVVLTFLGITATLVMVSNAFGRYVLGISITWAEEIVRILFVWSVFMAITHGFLKNEHIGFKNLSTLTPITKYLSNLLYAISLVFVGGALSYYGWKYNSMTGSVPLPGTNFPTAVFMLPGIFAGFIWFFIGFLRLIALLLKGKE